MLGEGMDARTFAGVSLTRFERRFSRLSPCERGEDEGEGLERTRPGLSLTLPLSLGKGEATHYARGDSKTSSQT
jgi:hypothetical protein